MKKPPFEVVNGRSPHHVLDLIPLSNQEKMSMEAEEFAAHIKKIHGEVREPLKHSSQVYKSNADAHRGNSEFKDGGLVMVYFCIKKDFLLVYITKSSKGSLVCAEY